MSALGTKAIDIKCSACGKPAGERCGTRFCLSRVLEAARITRRANAESKRVAGGNKHD